MRQHHLICLILLGVAVGCASKPQTPTTGLLSAQSFIKRWEQRLVNPKDPVTRLFVRDDRVIAYTGKHLGMWISTEGTLLSQYPISQGDRQVHPPVIIGDKTYIPTTLSIEIFGKNGNHLQTFVTPGAVQSPATGAGRAIYMSIATAGSGRLTRFTLGQDKPAFTWALHTDQGIISNPVVLNDSVYAGGNDGKVWAITGNRDPIWILDGGERTFQTNGKITADLAIDDYGLYVPSQDKRLYCIDRNSGRIRWTYYATAPLLDQPFLTQTHVYQIVPNVGLVAIDKTEGSQARPALWIQPSAQQVLSVDEKHVYVKSGGSILALDRGTGEVVFRSQRNDFTVFATNLKTSTIYAATRGGSILAIDPVLKPGLVGEMVMNESPVEAMAMVR